MRHLIGLLAALTLLISCSATTELHKPSVANVSPNPPSKPASNTDSAPTLPDPILPGPSTSEASSPAAISVSNSPAVPGGSARLAFNDDDRVYVVAEGAPPVQVGLGDVRAWSGNGRYLAWTIDERVSSSQTEPSVVVAILDADTGAIVRYRHQRPRPLSGQLVALNDGFVAVISGPADHTFGGTDFVILRPPALIGGVLPTAVHGDFGDRDNGDYDFDWVTNRNNNLYVTVTGASTSYYRYNPELWQVSFDGTATSVNLDDSCETCVSNIGFPLVSVSADTTHVAWVSGARAGGCDVSYGLSLQHVGALTRTPLTGLPVDDETTRTTFQELRWIDINTFVVDATSETFTVTYNDGPKCVSTNPIHRRLRCGTTGSCTAIATEPAYNTSVHGDTLTLNNPSDAGTVDPATITWTDGYTQEVIFSYQAVWAP